MKQIFHIFLFLGIISFGPVFGKDQIALAQSDIYFEPNLGQFPPEVRYLARGAKYRAWITRNEMVVQDNAPQGVSAPIRIRFSRQQASRRHQGLDQQHGISNYFIGRDPNKWVTNVPAYSRVRLEEVYKGIDIVFYGRSDRQEVEYDFVVKPGADPTQISVEFDSPYKPLLSSNGDLTIHTPSGRFSHGGIAVMQAGAKIPFEARLDGNQLRFQLADYDPSATLTVDPTVAYSTYLGGGFLETAKGVAVDGSGAAYVTGSTSSADFPTLNFGLAYSLKGTQDAFITKYSGTATGGGYQRVFSTYIGGSGANDSGGAIAIDSAGSAYVTGWTDGGDFPVLNATQTSPGGGVDAFVLKISPTNYGLVYSTYFGGAGEDLGNAIAVDSFGAAYVGGRTNSGNLPVLSAPYASPRGGEDGFVLKIAGIATGGTGKYDRVYSSYLGGSGSDQINGISVDASGAAYVAGTTTSTDFTVVSAAQALPGGGARDGFVAKFPAGPTGGTYGLVYSTYLGGTGNDSAAAIAVDGAGNAHITGSTDSTNFPLRNSIYQSGSTFVTKIGLQASGQPLAFGFVYSTYFGGPTDGGVGIALDPSGQVYVTGGSFSGGATTIPLLEQLVTPLTMAANGFAFKLSSAASGTPALLYSTYLVEVGGLFPAGIAVDTSGAAYIVSGHTTGAPVLNGQAAPPRGNPLVPDGNIYLMKLASAAAAVLIEADQSGIRFTTSGAGCDAGEHTTPKTFNWVAGTDCTVTFISPLEIGPGRQYRFARWENNTTNATRVIRATSVAASYRGYFDLYGELTVIVRPPGTATVSPAQAASGVYYKSGTVVNLNVTPNPGYVFVQYLGNTDGLSNTTQAAQSFVMTDVRSLYADTAVDSANGVRVEANAPAMSFSTAGGAVCDPGYHSTSFSFAWPAGTTCTLAFVPTQTIGIPNPEYRFVQWENGSTNPTRIFTSNGTAATLRGTFDTYYPVTVSTAGTQGGGTTTSPGSTYFKSGSNASYTATPSPGFIFTGWTGPGIPLTSTLTINLNVTGALTLIANFAPASSGTVAITINATAPGIKFTAGACAAGEQTTPTTLNLNPGTACNVIMPGVQNGAPGSQVQYQFVRWEDGSTQSTRVVPVGGVPATFVATYETYYVVSIGLGGSLGGGNVTPGGPVVNTWPAGTNLSYTAVANPGYLFTGWTGTPTLANPLSPTINITVAGPVALVANFAPINGAGGVGALQFVPVTPCRVADTRNPTGPLGGPSINGGTSREFPVPSSPCGVPAGAAAYSLNITVVPKGSLGYLTIWPSDRSMPVVSTLNALDGRVKANAAIVPAGANGGVYVFVTNTTDVVIDINGYFITPNVNSLAFYSIAPCRISDTRNAQGSLGGPALARLTTRTIPVQGATACGIPANARAYSLNATVIPKQTLGYLTIWPTGSTQPVVSTLNATTGTVVANAAIVPAGTNGSIDAFVTEDTDLVLDINGYFAPPGAAGQLNFFAALPCRISDTRNAPGPFGGPTQTGLVTREYAIPNSSCSIPANARAYSLNATVLPTGLFGYLTLWPSGGAMPVVSTLNAVDGALTSNASIVPAGIGGAINAFGTHNAHLLLDINGFFAP
jgi:hypothetical protein